MIDDKNKLSAIDVFNKLIEKIVLKTKFIIFGFHTSNVN